MDNYYRSDVMVVQLGVTILTVLKRKPWTENIITFTGTCCPESGNYILIKKLLSIAILLCTTLKWIMHAYCIIITCIIHLLFMKIQYTLSSWARPWADLGSANMGRQLNGRSLKKRSGGHSHQNLQDVLVVNNKANTS